LTSKNKTKLKANPLDIFKSSNSRLVLLNPRTFEVEPDAWIELAPINSAEGDKANAAIIASEKASSFNPTSMTDAEFMEYSFKRNRELGARLIVRWNEEHFGEFSTERALQLIEEYRAIAVQVDLHLKNSRNFYKA
jgi:hypothetical protein